MALRTKKYAKNSIEMYLAHGSSMYWSTLNFFKIKAVSVSISSVFIVIGDSGNVIMGITIRVVELLDFLHLWHLLRFLLIPLPGRLWEKS